MSEEKITPVTESEIDNIRVSLDLDDGSKVECKILTIFEAAGKEYIALLPLDADGKENPDGDVYLYRYAEDEKGIPSVEYIADADEYEAAADRFDELLDEAYYDSMDE